MLKKGAGTRVSEELGDRDHHAERFQRDPRETDNADKWKMPMREERG